MRRHGMKIGFGLCGVLLLAAAGSAWADNNPFVGKWHWNRAQSTLAPGEPVPSDMTAEFSRVDSAHVKWSITVTNAQGRASVESFDTPANGDFYPINGDTVAAFTVKGDTLQGTFKGPAGETDSLTCVLSTDRRKMTCKGAMTGSDGKTENYVDVYDRG